MSKFFSGLNARLAQIIFVSDAGWCKALLTDTVGEEVFVHRNARRILRLQGRDLLIENPRSGIEPPLPGDLIQVWDIQPPDSAEMNAKRVGAWSTNRHVVKMCRAAEKAAITLGQKERLEAEKEAKRKAAVAASQRKASGKKGKKAKVA